MVQKNQDKINWSQFCKRYNEFYRFGVNRELITGYDTSLIENLRNVCYGGIPASIVILSKEFCNGNCYESSLLLCLGFEEADEFQIVQADIDALTLNPELKKKSKHEHYGNHSFVERKMQDGSILVYDTSVGFVFEKNIYYKMQRPKITSIFNKIEILELPQYQEYKNANFDTAKYSAPAILPLIEQSNENSDNIYKEFLEEEIKAFKNKINYDELCKEISNDLHTLDLK